MKTVEKKAKSRSEETGVIIPKARKEGLIVRVLGEETLVYDLECDQLRDGCFPVAVLPGQGGKTVETMCSITFQIIDQRFFAQYTDNQPLLPCLGEDQARFFASTLSFLFHRLHPPG